LTEEPLRLTREGAALVAHVNRPPSNMFDGAMIEALTGKLRAAESSPELRFLRLCAEGDAFCLGRDPEGSSPVELRAVAARITSLNLELRRTPLVVVAEVQGNAAGFGAGMVACADVAVAADSAEFWFPELGAGLPPSIVISWLAKLVPRKVAFDLVASGRRFPAAEACDLGLVTDVVPAADLADAVDARLQQLGELDPTSLRDVKRMVNQAIRSDEDDAPEWATDALAVAALRLRER
jgi:methylglutaconyl-CoA hydratase